MSNAHYFLRLLFCCTTTVKLEFSVKILYWYLITHLTVISFDAEVSSDITRP